MSKVAFCYKVFNDFFFLFFQFFELLFFVDDLLVYSPILQNVVFAFFFYRCQFSHCFHLTFFSCIWRLFR